MTCRTIIPNISVVFEVSEIMKSWRHLDHGQVIEETGVGQVRWYMVHRLVQQSSTVQQVGIK